MAKISLSLKTPKAERSQIWATISEGRGINFKLYPGITIKSKHWSKISRCVLSAEPNAVEYNRHLEKFKKKALEIYNDAKLEGIQADASFIREKMKPKKIEKALNFWEIWEFYLTSKKGQFKKHSFVKFESLRVHLEKFEETIKGGLDLEKISQEQLEDLQYYMYEKRNLNTQSTSKYIGILKMFLNWCVKRKYTHNVDFQHFTPIKQPDTLKVIMTEGELKQIKELDLNELPHLANVRELFILSCLVGLRYSDYSRIAEQHLKIDEDGDPVLKIRQQKTEDEIELPLTQEAHQIVQKLISGHVHKISNQKMNEYVKDLCDKAQIHEKFDKVTYKGKDKKIEVVRKCDLISTHTGRRTFATRLLSEGVEAETVMEFTGHRDYKSFAKYVNIPRKTKKEKVKKALMGKPQMKIA